MMTSFVLLRPLVIVYDFNIPSIVIDPSKADAPLLIYPNAHLTGPASLKDFQSISRWISQVLQDCCGIQLAQLTQSPILNIARKLPARLSLPNTLRILAPK
jgi:hypothetical protein